MLDRKTLLAMNDVDNAFLEETALTLGYITEERTVAMNSYHKRSSRRFISLMIAACLLLSLGIAAYATELFGIRALLIKGEEMPPAITGEGGGIISITQPQDVPEEIDSAINEKIENSAKAWAEWTEYNKTHGLTRPEVCIEPEGCDLADYVENGDGTYTVIFYDAVLTHDDAGNVIDVQNEEMERRLVTAEEYEQEMAHMLMGSQGYPGYDFNYNVTSEEAANKLEEIAAKYGLNLRHQSTVMYENFDDFTEFNTFDEVKDKVNEICTDGEDFFRVLPTGFEKFYYFDEGTFAVSFFTSEDKSNMGTSCYLYNSPYSTLSSGYEIVGLVSDISAMNTYTHIAPDGTELTVLHNGAEMYAYVYLENSFVTLSFHDPEGLGSDEINEIIDMIDFTAIR